MIYGTRITISMEATSAIVEPLKVIDALFEQFVSRNGGNKPEGEFGVEAHFKSIVTDSNVHLVRCNSAEVACHVLTD
jgi:hypothetical protein